MRGESEILKKKFAYFATIKQGSSLHFVYSFSNTVYSDTLLVYGFLHSAGLSVNSLQS